MEFKNNKPPKICEDCIHKEVCKYKENIEEKKLEEPLEINCKYKQLIFKYNTSPMGPFYMNKTKWDSNSTTSYNPCKTCSYLIDGECKAPNNIIGLPCQTITCS